MKLTGPRVVLALVVVVAAVVVFSSSSGTAQQAASGSAAGKQAATPATDHDHADHARHQTEAKTLGEQLRELQQKVARLEAALKQDHAGQSTAAADSSGKGGMKGMMGMGRMSSGSKMGMGGMGGMNMSGMGMGGGMMKGMSGMGMQGMGMMGGGMNMSGMNMGGGSTSGMSGMSGMGGMGMMGHGMKGMKMMGQQPGMGQMSMPTALPGYPGASHIYHIGATGFFLDHPQHITLSNEQLTQLNEIKSAALLKQDEFDRSIQEAEQQLWVLTSSDTPDISKIDASVRQIAKQRGDQQIAFIRSVGEAAGVLTAEQRKVLVGELPPDHASQGATSDSDAADHSAH